MEVVHRIVIKQEKVLVIRVEEVPLTGPQVVVTIEQG